MPQYRYVSQGEYYITTNANVIPITSGMTECIAIGFVDTGNSNNRLVAHMDGMNLESKATAKDNLVEMLNAFKKETECKEIKIYTLGGQKRLQNFNNLRSALDELKMEATMEDTNNFCDGINKAIRERNRLSPLFNPTNIGLTLIFPPKAAPEFKSFSPRLFEPPLSLEKLENGYGLVGDELKLFENFNKANEQVLANNPEVAKKIRNYKDKTFVDDYLKASNPLSPKNG